MGSNSTSRGVAADCAAVWPVQETNARSRAVASEAKIELPIKKRFMSESGYHAIIASNCRRLKHSGLTGIGWTLYAGVNSVRLLGRHSQSRKGRGVRRKRKMRRWH